MRIAMLAPLIEAVPPPLYGGTERVVSVLTEELVRRGHAVTLFASGDSRTSARLFACCPRGLRLDPEVRDTVACTLVQLDEVYHRAAEFELIHNHVDYFAFPFARLVATPTVTTTHGRLDRAEVRRLYGHFPEQPLVSISDAQRLPLPGANWLATVYNGIDLAHFSLQSRGSPRWIGALAAGTWSGVSPRRRWPTATSAPTRGSLAAVVQAPSEYWRKPRRMTPPGSPRRSRARP